MDNPTTPLDLENLYPRLRSYERRCRESAYFNGPGHDYTAMAVEVLSQITHAKISNLKDKKVIKPAELTSYANILYRVTQTADRLSSNANDTLSYEENAPPPFRPKKNCSARASLPICTTSSLRPWAWTLLQPNPPRAIFRPRDPHRSHYPIIPISPILPISPTPL